MSNINTSAGFFWFFIENRNTCLASQSCYASHRQQVCSWLLFCILIDIQDHGYVSSNGWRIFFTPAMTSWETLRVTEYKIKFINVK